MLLEKDLEASEDENSKENGTSFECTVVLPDAKYLL